ncbi:RHH-type rel operon transcriptional repressor/antitoxin RelB [Sphingomonas sp. PP-F2F-G114-C0414]|uniref:type II toxin-antitoxin system RelB family antitoxin n=1 Tax=Sphingomonas sp. PP-F2F-G114-C0414 TaxID=2135662 RepID=UPI000EF909E1|nr:ribbon-helix-helix protein, CopG family [Sphingomonas sp. PP-F2F-G114-C0414]RMB36143.1 RHH-type rel operon transcriptional repressor/antitoxin RelB [Sphingomonas sp. PP-F2F-G114-C0414]
MLGVRLDNELEERLAAVARTQGRSKSDIAREAVRRYVERHDEAFLAEAKRQSLAAAALGWTEEDDAWERLGVAWDDPELTSNRRDAAE